MTDPSLGLQAVLNSNTIDSAEQVTFHMGLICLVNLTDSSHDGTSIISLTAPHTGNELGENYILFKYSTATSGRTD
jgi:hypothetical protein